MQEIEKIAAEAAEQQVCALEERGYLDFDGGEQEDRVSVVEQLRDMIQSAIEKAGLAQRDLPAFAEGYAQGVADSAAHASEPDLMLEDCTLIAHNTGEGWYLAVQNRDGDDIAILKWPWGDKGKNAQQLEEYGYEII